MTLPIWVLFGIIIGLLGYALDSHRSLEGLVGGLLLGITGAFQGFLISTILTSIPLSSLTPSPLLFSFAGGILLLLLGKITKKAF